VNLLGSLTTALKSSERVKSTSFPLFKRVVEFVAIIDDFGKPVPLLSIKPRKTYNHLAIGSRPGHVRRCRGLTPRFRRGLSAQREDRRLEPLDTD